MNEIERAPPTAGLLDTPIHVHVSWIAVLALVMWQPGAGLVAPYASEAPPFSWIPGLVTAALLVVSVLLHELGHTLMALRHGIAIRSITLFVFGGVMQTEKDPENGRTELAIAAVGPLVSLVLAAGFYAASWSPFLGGDGPAIAWVMAVANLALAVLNVVPAFPVDGGRMLRGLMWNDRGAQRTTAIAFHAGQWLALGIVTLGLFRLSADDAFGAAGCALLAWVLKDGTLAVGTRVRLHDTLRGLAVRDAMLTEMAAVPAHVRVSELSPVDMLRGGLPACPVVRGHRVVGILAVDKVLALSKEERGRTSVQALMMPLYEGVLTDPGAPLLDAMARLTRIGAGPLLVVKDGDVYGILSLRSILRHHLVRAVLAS